MSLKTFCFALTFLLFFGLGFSMELYIPRDIKQTYVNKTPDKSGLPGENYWQNRATYHIQLKINPPDRKIQGSEEIIYTNNSPDTLEQLNFKLIMNHHKPGAPRAYSVPENYLTTGVHIERFVENGQERSWEAKETDGTDKFVKLTKPLLPGKSVQFTIDWFWKARFFSNHYIDIGIVEIAKDGEGLLLRLANEGCFPVPFTLVVTFEDGTEQRFTQSPRIWEADLDSAEVRLPVTVPYKNIYLDNGIFVDADSSDNTWKLK